MNGRCRRAKPKPRDRCAQEGLPPAGARHEELALRPHAPRKYSTNYHVLFGKSSFFSKFEDSINREEKEDPMEERRGEAEAGHRYKWWPAAACSREVYSWRQLSV